MHFMITLWMLAAPPATPPAVTPPTIDINRAFLQLYLYFSAFLGGAGAASLFYAACLSIFSGGNPRHEEHARAAVMGGISGIFLGAVSYTLATGFLAALFK